jgi:hypothetical protein
MSTSIPRGFRMKDMTVGGLQGLLRRFRAEAIPAAYGLLAAHMAAEAARVVDLAALGKRLPEADRPLSRIWERVRKDWKEARGGSRHPEIDVECEISFASAEGWLLGIVHTEHDELHDLWMRTSGAEDFSWWNGSDSRPKGVSAAEWKERGRLWRAALPGSGVPSECGFSFALVGERLAPLDRADIVAAQPSLEQRASALAEEQVLLEFMAGPGRPDYADDGDRMEAAMRAADATRRRLASPEGRARLAEATGEIAARLKPVLDEADMLGWRPKEDVHEAPAPGMRP